MDSAPVADDVRIITLVRGMMQQGGFYWCYVAIKPDLIRKFQQAVKNKYNIQNFVKDEYGEVIVSGRGKEPPAEITAKVSEMFGVTFQQIEEGNSEVSIAKILAAMEEAKK
ncbi:MAG: hypothetical protein AABY33_04495 [Pseudomonadota bacterium]